MTAEEFWKKYTKENILDIFDITCDFFSKELPADFIQNYDVGEVIVETKGHNQKAIVIQVDFNYFYRRLAIKP